MAKIASSEIVVSHTDSENTQDSGQFYPVFSWLRDTCIPEVRPLFNWFQDYYDDNLQAAALVRHTLNNGKLSYELFIMYENTLLSFQPQGRWTAGPEDFTNLVISRSHMER